MMHTRTKKRYKVKTPGGRTVVHTKKKKHSALRCSNCGAKLNRPKLSLRETSKMPKTEKRPQRPFPDLCSKCMRTRFKEIARK